MVKMKEEKQILIQILKNESGTFSLVEMMFFVLIFVFILAATYNLFYFSQKTWSKTSQDSEVRQNARFAMDKSVKEIRQAQSPSESDYGVYLADQFEFQFYSDINSDLGPERIHYYLNNNEFIRGELNPSTQEEPWEYGGTEGTEAIAKYIRNAGSDYVFRYYDSDGNELTNLPLDSVDKKKIRRVKITLLVDKEPDKLPDQLEVESEVQLRNLRD